MIVTIDGPAGAGKSSIARQLAEKIGFEFLDTGALYRAVTWAALKHHVDLNDPQALTRLAQSLDLRWEQGRVWVDGQEITDQLHQPDVTAAIGRVADVPEIRRVLTNIQRQIAQGRNIVTDGRDQGTEVFPNAECKIFLTASPLERARRRQRQLAERGIQMSIEEILEAQNRRDEEDSRRPVGALRPADDAIVINTDGMSPQEVLQRCVELVEAAMKRHGVTAPKHHEA